MQNNDSPPLENPTTNPLSVEFATMVDPDTTSPSLDDNRGLSGLPPEKAMSLFSENPVGFIQTVIDTEAAKHLATLKEQAELDAALKTFKQSQPEFERFQPFIMHEAVKLLQTDTSVANDSWPQIFEKASRNFKQTLAQTVQEGKLGMNNEQSQPPHVEGSSNRQAAETPASFTRAQIGKMSMADFLKNESAINEALKNNRIQ
jgi:hypothetical protein